MTEKEILKILTDKLVKVAKWPNLRKHFTVAWYTSGDDSCEVHFYKDDPKMSNIEYATLVYYYANKLERVRNEEKAQHIFNKAIEMCTHILDSCDRARVASLLYMTRYYELRNRGDINGAFDMCYHWLQALVHSSDGAGVNVFNEFIAVLHEKGDLQWLIDVIDDCNQYIEEQQKKWEEDENYYTEYVNSVYEYVCSKAELLDEDDRFILDAILQIYNIIALPKRERNKKGSFDYNYAKAENGDKEYQLLVAKAYREGDGVPKNIRLANLWEGFANNKIVE